MSDAASAVVKALTYRVNDADEHSTPPLDAYERYIDPKAKAMAVRTVRNPDGTLETLHNGRPLRLKAKNRQVVLSDEQLAELGVQGHGEEVGTGNEESGGEAPVPGSLLNRLNPLRTLDAEGRKEFVRRYRALQPQLDDPVSRLAVMDEMGIEATVNYAGPLALEFEFEGDIEALYANIRAINRYLATEWGFAHRSRIFTPAFVPMVSPDHALAELDHLLADGPPKLVQISTGPSIHTSPFRPEHDRFWARVQDAGINICTHLADVTFYGHQALEWSLPEVSLGDMDAFQWVFYYGDRPAMETVGAAILQGFFARFPRIRLLISEQGSVWVPYVVRKMDHAFLMGRRPSWGTLEKRPSEYFRENVLVAPFPEENIDRVVEAVGTEPLVFGSDFPHAEGLPDVSLYLGQLKNLSDDQVKAVMRDNMAEFLDLSA
jgi:predicted TIM-barrel fold metal-dependent hydrolase